MIDYRVFAPNECPKELFRFRYDIYVSELNRPQTHARHDMQTIIDPLDECGFQGLAQSHRKIIGCVRLNLVRDGGIDFYDQFYELNRLPAEKRETASICSRYMVAKAYRHSRVSIELLKMIYLFGIENGVDACYMDTNAEYVQYYLKFGYKTLFEKVHPDYGQVTVMRLDSIDFDYLKSVKSPFAPVCRRFLEKKSRRTANNAHARHAASCVAT